MERISFLILLFLSVSYSFCSAQAHIPLDEEAYLVKLESTNIQDNNDSINLMKNLLLADYWVQLDSTKSYLALKKSENLIIKNTSLKRFTFYFRGMYQHHRGNKQQAIDDFENSIKSLNNQTDSLSLYLLALSHYQLHYLQLSKKGYQSIIEIITNHCIPLATKINNDELKAYFYTQMGLAFMSVGQFKKAEEQHKKSLEILNNLPIGSSHLITYFNLISNYCYQANSAAAKPYLDKSTEIINKYPNSQHITNYHYQLAMYYTTKTMYDKALQVLETGIHHAKKRNQTQLLQLMQFRKYNAFLMQKNYAKAKEYLEHIMTEGILTQEAVNRKIVFAQMAQVNALLQNYEQAFFWQQKTTSLSDSLQQANLLEKMNELEVLHRTSEQENTIDKLKLEQAKNELESKQRNNRFLIVAIALLVVIIISISLYINYRNQAKLTLQISINHKQELLRLEDQRKYDASQALLVGEEKERKRIAQDLHDSLGGMLAGIRMKLDQESSNTTSSSNILQDIDQALAELRRISRNIMPETLQNRGLEAAIRELCHAMTSPLTQYHFESFELEKDIPFQIQLTLYRVCQEAISNIIKYANASEVIVQLSQSTKEIRLTIEDNGKGFDIANTTFGLGLKNMTNRMHLINGTLDIDSTPNQGTTLNYTCNVS